ncbi:transcriptional regulator, GntR family [Paenibacillus curdlanolyticus YK9]|uniref:Transcriptional regulator, GntR family n=1 Tax=Paenibacillus curdlanolyticus YK9 TaxID=717606 RepID=E0I3G4_9BACL|nr:GntR family transcriptional regulator [Paenibacillus curdlanolyticus]EFM12828.1 transcriptional regulator, GntR family [Paenibacillus curdlanolyticus YK9]
MTLIFNNRDPVYLQVVRHFKERIATGKLNAGETIPSRRELASQLNINPNTAQKAYKEMEEQGLIVTEGNSPSRITGDNVILGRIREELLTEAVDSFLASVSNIEVPIEQLLTIIRIRHEKAESAGTETEGGIS